MLYRTRSYTGGLAGLQFHENIILTDRALPKVGRHGQSDRHGPSLPKSLRRYDSSACQSLSKDRSHTPAYASLTTHNTAPACSTRGNSNRQGLPQKESLTKQLVQGASVPAYVTYKEQPCMESFLLDKAKSITEQPVETLRGQRELGSNDSKSKSGDKVHDDHEVLRSSTPVCSESPSRHGVAESSCPVSTCTYPTKRVENGPEETSTLRKMWKQKKEKRRMGSLILLNVLAALYGSSNVANGLVSDAAPSLPASLTALVRFTSALFFFAPALMSALENRDMGLLRAGAELGGLTFAATVVDSCNPTSGSSSSAALLFAFTVIFVPIMELLAGRHTNSTLTRFATLAAIVGMGLLEEEGFGWRGVSCPQIGDLWGMAVSIISAVHIFRSEAHSGRFDPLRLNAVQCGVLAILSLGWETVNTFDATAFRSHEIFDQIHSLPWAPLIYNGLVCFGLCSWLELHGLRSIHASTATLVYTTIPVWGAFLSFFANHEAPAESATIGGLVIMGTSIYAQMTTKNADMHPQIQSRNSPPARTNSRPVYQEGSAWTNFRSGSDMTTTKEELIADEESKVGEKPSDHSYKFPGALLTSQLKFPYYAAQAKRLLADLKVKLLAMKSVLLTTVSSGVVSSTSGTSVSPGGNPVSGSAPAGGQPNVHGAGSLPPSGSGPMNTLTPHIGTLDASTTAQHIAPHGPAIVGPLSSSSTDIMNVALSSSHKPDPTVIVNLGTHTLAAVTTGLESALVAIGSDIMLGFEEAEDVATLLERLIQVGVENAAHTVAACMSGGATWLPNTLSDPSNVLDRASHLQQTLLGGSFVSPFPSNMAEMANSMFQQVLPFINHLHG